MRKSTLFFEKTPVIVATSSVAGPKECEGIIGKYVDTRLSDDTFGEPTFEKAESKMLSTVISGAMKKANKKEDEVDLLLLGDLLNQIISSSFAARDYRIPYLGLYGACSTMAEGLAVGASFLNAGYVKNVIAATGSHFSSAERQYRFPLEQGTTRPPVSQWTVTGAGGFLLSSKGEGVKIECATLGRVVDFGVKDVNNMGAAMAPAAADTILTHLRDTGRRASDYDLIVTGDLGALGSRLVKHLTKQSGVDMQENHVDCGEIVYNVIEDEFQGGSGAGCSALVLSSYLYHEMINRKIKRLLFCATGALLSTVSSGQGESIPCICHAVSLTI